MLMHFFSSYLYYVSLSLIYYSEMMIYLMDCHTFIILHIIYSECFNVSYLNKHFSMYYFKYVLFIFYSYSSCCAWRFLQSWEKCWGVLVAKLVDVPVPESFIIQLNFFYQLLWNIILVFIDYGIPQYNSTSIGREKMKNWTVLTKIQ